jgi:hypothetical protein
VLSDLYKGSTRSSDIGKKISDSMKKQYATGVRTPHNKRNINDE